jgi:hypothetical protein
VLIAEIAGVVHVGAQGRAASGGLPRPAALRPHIEEVGVDRDGRLSQHLPSLLGRVGFRRLRQTLRGLGAGCAFAAGLRALVGVDQQLGLKTLRGRLDHH